MLSTSQAVRRQAQKNSWIAFSAAKNQLRFASHSSNPEVSEIARIMSKKQESRIKNIPLNLLHNPSSPSSSSASFSALGESGSIAPGLSKAFSARILADSNNNGGDDSSKSPKTSSKSDKSDKNDKEDKQSDPEASKDESKPEPKSKKEPTSDESKTITPESTRQGTRSSRSKTSSQNSSERSSSLLQSKSPDPESRTNNTDHYFSVASASEKKQVLILPINRRPLIPGMNPNSC